MALVGMHATGKESTEVGQEQDRNSSPVQNSSCGHVKLLVKEE